MWLSTVQSFKILRSVRKSFESKSKESEKWKYGKRTKRRNTYQTKKPSNPELQQPKRNSDISVYQQNILISKDFNLKSQSVKKLTFQIFL